MSICRDSQKKQLQERHLRKQQKTCEKQLRGDQPLIWHRVIERDLNFNTKYAIIKAQDRENYHINIVIREKAKSIEGILPEADLESTE